MDKSLRMEIIKQFRSDRKMKDILLRIAGIAHEDVEDIDALREVTGYRDGQSIYVQSDDKQCFFEDDAPADVLSQAGTACAGTIAISGETEETGQFVVAITTQGSATTARFKYSLDGGDNWVTNQTASASFDVGETGIVLAFTGAAADAFKVDALWTLDLGFNNNAYRPFNVDISDTGRWIKEKAEESELGAFVACDNSTGVYDGFTRAFICQDQGMAPAKLIVKIVETEAVENVDDALAEFPAGTTAYLLRYTADGAFETVAEVDVGEQSYYEEDIE